MRNEWFISPTGKLLGMIPFGKLTTVVPLKEGFELLGMKWLPGLTTSQAKEVTPCEVGDRLWKDNIHTLVSGNLMLSLSCAYNVHVCMTVSNN